THGGSSCDEAANILGLVLVYQCSGLQGEGIPYGSALPITATK
ncbi:MAG: hypothetical protein JWM03_1357, partial [Rhodocyclales bacterium]|nr:hypothetical protein [Rhodocyclales bacterium]